MEKNNKQGDLGIFIIGWVASALAVGVPTLCLVLIKKYSPDTATDYGDKVSIIAYLLGAFFSGLFTTYRVVCKASEKDLEIQEKNNEILRLEKEIEESKKAYRTLSPKSKIISLLLEVHQVCSSSSKQETTALIMTKIKEINSDTTFEPRYDGMLAHVSDADYKKEQKSNKPTISSEGTEYHNTIISKNIFFKNTKA